MVEHELCNVLPELHARLVIDPSVRAPIDPAQASIHRRVCIAGKDQSGAVIGYPHLIMITEERGQHDRSGCANRAVGGWIRRIRWGGDERRLGWVADYEWISDRIGLTDCRDGSPQLVVVFGIIEGDCAVCEG